MTRLSPPIEAQREAFLTLEYQASAAFNAFAYSDRARADAIRGALFDKGVAEYAPAHSRVLTDNGNVAGMISCLSAEALGKCRMRAAFALARSDFFAGDPGLQDRLALAGRAMMRLAPGDFYLSRIAVAPNAAGRGQGARLLEHCEEEAARAGAARIALEVSADNQIAIAFYRKHGFVELDRQSVSDPIAGRGLAYVHMARPV